jgi:hypothetical protein
VLRSGAELDRIFEREESGRARKYGSSFSRSEVKTGEASLERRGDCCAEVGGEDASGEGVRRMDGRRRGAAGEVGICEHPTAEAGISILSGRRTSPIGERAMSAGVESVSTALREAAWS